MNTARRLLLLEQQTLQGYLAGLGGANAIVFRLNSTSALINLAGNANLNATTINGSPALVDSPFGTNQGLALNANGKWARVPNGADAVTLGNTASYTIMARFRLAASPGNTTRFVYSWDSANHNLTISVADKLSAIRTSNGGTDAQAASTASIPEGSNIAVAEVFNPADKPNGIRLYSGTTSYSEMALTTDTTLTVALGQINTQNLYVGDRSNAGGDRNILAEMFDFFAYLPVGMTLAQLNTALSMLPK